MLEQLHENETPANGVINPIRFDFDWMDEPMKGKKHKEKRKKRKKSARNRDKYAQLAFQYGVLASRYDMLSRMVQLAVSAKRQQLDDDLLDNGLVALRPPRIAPLPEL